MGFVAGPAARDVTGQECPPAWPFLRFPQARNDEVAGDRATGACESVPDSERVNLGVRPGCVLGVPSVSRFETSW